MILWSEWHASTLRISMSISPVFFSFGASDHLSANRYWWRRSNAACGFVLPDQQILFCRGHDLPIRLRRARLTMRGDLIRMWSRSKVQGMYGETRLTKHRRGSHENWRNGRRFSCEAWRWKFDEQRGSTRVMGFGPNPEFWRRHRETCNWKYRETRNKEIKDFNHCVQFASNTKMEYSFCRSSSKNKWMREREPSWIVLQEMNWEKLQDMLLIGDFFDLFNVRSYHSWKRLLRESALRQKCRKETHSTEVVRRDSKVGSRTKIGNIGEWQNWAGQESTWVKLALADDQEAIKLMQAKSYVFSNSVLCAGKMHEYPLNLKKKMGNSKFVVEGHTSVQRTGWNRWRASGVRVGAHTQVTRHCKSSTRSRNVWNPSNAEKKFCKDELSSCRCFTTSSGEMSTTKRYCSASECVRQKGHRRSLVIPRAWFSDDMVQYTQCEYWRSMRRCSETFVVQLPGESASRASCNQSVGTRLIEK